MNWIAYALSGAFFQAIEMSVKKKALKVGTGMNNLIAFLAYSIAGILLLIFFLIISNNNFYVRDFSNFANGIFWTVILNVIAVFFLYKALDITDLSYLMPFFSFISLSVIIPPIFMFGEFPTWKTLIGILLVIFGAILIDYQKKTENAEKNFEQSVKNKKAKFYFLIVAICWTFSTPMTKLAVLESSPILVSAIVNILIALSFIFMIYTFKEKSKILNTWRNFKKTERTNFISAIILAGFAIAISIGSINVALQYAQVSYVIAIKRIMPVFTFFIGYFYFKEKQNVKRKIIATLLMVMGAIIIGVFA